MRLNNKQKRLLKESIDIWKKDRTRLKRIRKCCMYFGLNGALLEIQYGKNFGKYIGHYRVNCPLCFEYSSCSSWPIAISTNNCQDCPIAIAVGATSCRNTPYVMWRTSKTKKQAIEAHDKMIEFMEKILEGAV